MPEAEALLAEKVEESPATNSKPKPAKDKKKGGKPFDLDHQMENFDGSPNEAEKNTLGDALVFATRSTYPKENADKGQKKKRARLWRKILKYMRRDEGQRIVHLDGDEQAEVMACCEHGLENYLWAQVYERFEDCTLEPDDDEE